MSLHAKPDIPLIIIMLLLLVTLTAFFAGVFPYPYGFIVLSIILVGRIMQLKSRG